MNKRHRSPAASDGGNLVAPSISISGFKALGLGFSLPVMTAIRAKVDAFNAMIRDLREHDPAIRFGARGDLPGAAR
jgi:hypothetical protein